MISLQLPKRDALSLMVSDLAFVKAPFLCDMWPRQEALWAKDATHGWQLNPTDDGEVLFITKDGEVIGLTGWFEDSPSSVGIRWHCVHHDHRNQGVSKEALRLMLARVPERYSHAYECATETAIDHFKKCGFTPVLDPAAVSGIQKRAGYDGTVLEYDLKKLR